MANKKTLVIGASQNPSRYSYLAMNRLRQKGHEVVAIGTREATVNGITIEKEKKSFENVDTVTLYPKSTTATGIPRLYSFPASKTNHL